MGEAKEEERGGKRGEGGRGEGEGMGRSGDNLCAKRSAAPFEKQFEVSNCFVPLKKYNVDCLHLSFC